MTLISKVLCVPSEEFLLTKNWIKKAFQNIDFLTSEELVQVFLMKWEEEFGFHFGFGVGRT